MPRGRKTAADTAAEGKGKHLRKPVEKTFVQYAGAEWDVDELKEKVRAAYVAEGHYAASIHDLRLYVKPEDGKAYFTINQKFSGSVEL